MTLIALEKPRKWSWECPVCKIPITGEMTHVAMLARPHVESEARAFERHFEAEVAKHQLTHVRKVAS